MPNDDDIYVVTLTAGSSIYTTTATHQGAGLYEATLTPTMVGVYTMQVTMSNVYTNAVGGLNPEVSGSPFTVDIFEPSLTGDILGFYRQLHP